MAGKTRHLLNREGGYLARLVVPKDLRPCLDGKAGFRTALGPDYRTGLKRLPGAVAEMQRNIALAERKVSAAQGRVPMAT